MAPNHFIQHVKHNLKISPQEISCPAGCGQKFRSRGGSTKHLNFTHPNYISNGDVSQHSSPSDIDGSCKMGSVHSEPNLPTSDWASSSPPPATSLNDFPMQDVIGMDDDIPRMQQRSMEPEI